MQNFKLINFITLALVGNKNFQFFTVELCAYMRPIISYKELLSMAKWRKSMNYFVFISRNHHCFTGNVKFDVASANKIINNTINNNSAHGYVSAFKWAYNNFYGMKLTLSILLADLKRFLSLLPD